MVSPKGKMELNQEILNLQRKAVVLKNMKLDNVEDEKFWPVYNEFRSKMEEINKLKINLILSFAESFNKRSLSDAAGVWLGHRPGRRPQNRSS